MSPTKTIPRPVVAPSMKPPVPAEERGVMRGVSWNCFNPDKVAACRAAEALGSNDIAAFPIPDLAVEIDISPPKIDRADIYSKLRAPEVWRLSNDAVSIEQLDASAKYVAADASRFLCVRADEVTQWLREGRSTTQPTWRRAVREWARAVPRPRAGL